MHETRAVVEDAADVRSVSEIQSRQSHHSAPVKSSDRGQTSFESKDERQLSPNVADAQRRSTPVSRPATVHHALVPPKSPTKANERRHTLGQQALSANGSNFVAAVVKESKSLPRQTTLLPTNIIINSFDEKDVNRNENEGAFFRDGKRRVDFVLVYEHGVHRIASGGGRMGRFIDKDQQRAFFERNLVEAGLQLEEDAHLYDSGRRSRLSIRHPAGVGPGHSRNPSRNPSPNPSLSVRGGVSPRTKLRSTIFVKINAPFEILCSQAEKLNLKMPLKISDPFDDGSKNTTEDDESENIFVSFLKKIKNAKRKFLKKATIAQETPHGIIGLAQAAGSNGLGSGPAFLNGKAPFAASSPAANGSANGVTWSFSRRRIDMFDLGDNPSNTFFTPTQRLEMVWNMLQEARNDPEDEKRRGIERLLDTGVYEKAFALHDGECGHRNQKTATTSGQHDCQRETLRRIWADWRCVFRRQPLNLIRSYFGEKAGFYFAFLGFYTKMLIFPSVIGLVSFLYGMWNTNDDIIVKDICDPYSAPGNFMMCPLCRPPHCKFTQLSFGCWNARWDYRMDNEATLVVACLTVVWSTVMLKMWKRREAELAYQWDTHDVEQEDVVIRPEYEERAPAKRRNPVTRELEPHVPPMTKASWMLASTCVTLLMLSAVGAALFFLVIARIALYGAFAHVVEDNVELSRWLIHGLIFIVVFIFEKVYHSVAHKLTSLECPRTQEAWLSSFLWKVFIFELLNDFVPIAYAAWVKGKSVQTPLDLDWHSELCDTGGCMGEVTELTAVLLLMRLVVGNAAEIGWPLAKNAYHQLQQQQEIVEHSMPSFENPTFHNANNNNNHLNVETETGGGNRKSRWHADYLLNDPELDGVAEEYMEMMIQFAFCTLFVPAFPLAPLVCFLNNILEIRVDATNFVRANRRPLPIRVAGIQIWNHFLSIISKLSIICNAGLIAFTSTIVPRLYYKYAVNLGSSYENYTQFSVSMIHRNAWSLLGKAEAAEAFHAQNITECYYEDYRSAEYPYDRVQHWWEVACVRLGVFSGFILLGFTFEWLFNFVVDDTPAHVALNVQRKRYFVTKTMEAHDEAREKKAEQDANNLPMYVQRYMHQANAN